MEAIYAAHGGQALDLEIINAEPGNGSKVYGNDARFADVHFAVAGAGSTLTAVAALGGVTSDSVSEGSGAQDNANANTKLILGDKADAADATYVGQTLRVYEKSSRGLAAAKPLTGSNSPHGPKGYTDHVISSWTKATKLAEFSPALPFVPKTEHDGADYGGSDKLDVDYEILPGIKATGTHADHKGDILVLAARLHVPQV